MFRRQIQMPNEKIFVALIRVLVIGALLLFLVGDESGVWLLQVAAGVMFGAGLILAGIQGWLTGQIVLWNQKQDSADPLDNVPGSVWGIALIGMGVTVILLVVAFVLGLDRRVEGALSRFAETPLGLPIIWLVLGGGAVMWGHLIRPQAIVVMGGTASFIDPAPSWACALCNWLAYLRATSRAVVVRRAGSAAVELVYVVVKVIVSMMILCEKREFS